MNQRGENEDTQLTVRPEKTRLVIYLLYLSGSAGARARKLVGSQAKSSTATRIAVSKSEKLNLLGCLK